MGVWIALLRGVNVGGHKKLPMAEFRAVLSGLGFQDVATYIQSGNVVFRADGCADTIAQMIGAALADHFGFEADVFVMSRREMRGAIAQNPFPLAEQDPKTLHLFVLKQPVALLDPKAMQASATRGEEFKLIGRIFYLYTPNGFGRSDLAGKLTRLIPSSMTGRNLRSCHKINEMADAL